MSFYKEVPGRQTTLESTLKFDTAPTSGSTNPVTSDGVKGAIDGAVGDASEALQQQIDDIAEKAGSGYIPKGEASVATLNGLSGQENGELYTMTNAGTLTLGSLAVVAGDTVAWDAANSVWYKAMNYAPASTAQTKREILYSFSGIEWTDGYYVHKDNGELTANASLSVTDYLDVGTDGATRVTTNATANGNVGVCFYNADKMFIGGVSRPSYGADEVNFEIPYGTQFVRVSTNTNVKAITFVRLSVIVLDAFQKIGEEKENENVVYSFDSIVWTDNSYINHTNGNVVSSSDFKCTDFLDLSLCDCTRVKTNAYFGGATVGGAFYNERRQYISGIKRESSSGDVRSWVVPDGAKYVRLSCYSTRVNTAIIQLTNNLNDLFGKMNSYSDEILRAELEIEWIDNYSVSGNDGQISGTSYYSCSDFIDVAQYKATRISTNAAFSGSAGVAFYNDEKIFISGYSEGSFTSVERPYVIPFGAKYMRISTYRTRTSETFVNVLAVEEDLYEYLGSDVSEQNRNLVLSRIQMPKIKFVGDMEGMTKENPKVVQFTFNDGTNTYNGYSEIKWQGSSSLTYVKKNYSIKFYEDDAKTTPLNIVAKSDWDVYGAQNKYVLKANYIDFSHCRNVVSAKLWGQLVKSRTTQNEYLYPLPNGGAIDGFPCMVYMNGKYIGIYTFNIPKDRWLFNMSKTSENKTAIIACEEYSQPCYFNSLDGDFSGEEGADFTIEHNSNNFPTEDVITSYNDLIAFCMNNSGSDFKNGISQYLDVEAAIDYFIFITATEAVDNWARNLIMVTYDGVKWIPSAYDLDSTWGNSTNGTGVYSPTYHAYNEFSSFGRLWSLLDTNFKDEIKARYNELREAALSEANVYTEFEKFYGSIPKFLFDEEVKLYPNIANTSMKDAGQIVNLYNIRAAYNDKKFNPS